MHIDKFKKEDGYYNSNECFYENAVDFITIEILDFCGCGCPEDALIYVKNALQLVKDKEELIYEVWKEKAKKLFNSDGAEYFMWYFLDNKEFTEHGSSVPGWLTTKGEELLEDLIELKLENLIE